MGEELEFRKCSTEEKKTKIGGYRKVNPPLNKHRSREETLFWPF